MPYVRVQATVFVNDWGEDRTNHMKGQMEEMINLEVLQIHAVEMNEPKEFDIAHGMEFEKDGEVFVDFDIVHQKSEFDTIWGRLVVEKEELKKMIGEG